MLLRAQVLMRAPLCVHCETEGRVALADEVDHIIPIAKGGTDDTDNLQGLCHDHHARKTAVEQGKDAATTFGLDGMPLDAAHHWRA